ncbi:hypothetical protein RFI_32570 [Reticulomyxa filosa]|uniref:SMP-30/Gluconolactonase/LRE-like region domain-containing protein n=1 Tax=Reticulomyxa filosa TaxID=46433 RepID=X6LVU2_RETFI|nr:hypothetical protein RFI_32570 [Reticulomyxa filosa]|eukprot:ETO04825.1 hypothetical protein RFI_32570 [Reticulomyxa filosa]
MHKLLSLNSPLSYPVIAPNGNIAVTSASGHILELCETENGLSETKVILELETQANGMQFAENGHIVLCDTSSQSLGLLNMTIFFSFKKIIFNQIVLYSPTNSNKDNEMKESQKVDTSYSYERKVLCNEYENISLKGPIACTIDNYGRIYFTDGGVFGQSCASVNASKLNGSVFMVANDGTLKVICYHSLTYPSDIICTKSREKNNKSDQDHALLYVTDLYCNRIWRFVEVSKNNHLFIGGVFFTFNGGLGPYGLTCDNQNNLYVARYEMKVTNNCGYISVINPSGKLIAEMDSLNIAPQLNGICFHPLNSQNKKKQDPQENDSTEH